MRKFAQLTPDQRYKIDVLFNLSTGLNQKQIAEQVGISESTLSRELRRNSRPRAGYEAKKAQEFAQKRRSKKPFKIKGVLEKTIREQLDQEWSPEQIVGRMEVQKGDENSQSVSIETVYQYVYRQHKQGDKIYVKLRRRHKKRRKRQIGTLSFVPSFFDIYG